jgi:hypothetical protein
MPFVDRTTVCFAAALLAGCSRVAPAPDGELEHYSEGFAQLHYTRASKVDILFVLDNSSSMADQQALLAENLGSFIEVLEHDSVDANYRIAITTTDAGHPACTSSTPERGAFLLTPCTSRLDEFVADGERGPSDVRAVACSDICGLDSADLEILPTTTDEDPIPRPRPWLERINGGNNLREGVDMADALRCFAPQGVAGCDFEMPLESMHQGLLRAKDATDPAYGFLRKDAALMVVFVTDEDDCSVAPGAQEIFSADGDKLFWSDQDAAGPTSAVCWNAGVTCVGDPSGYDSCEATNKDLTGNEGVADTDAVLQPINRYVELFDTIMADKRALDPTQQPLIGILGGVNINGNLVFTDVGDNDPEFQQTFGIGPGCTGYSPAAVPPIRATPPVRLNAALTALGSEGNIFSICESNWSPVLEPLGSLFWWGWGWGSIRPACFPYCALDTDPTTIQLEPDCIVEEHLIDSDQSEHIPECARDEHGYIINAETHDYQMPSDDVHVCHATLIDDMMSTPNTADDMSPECTDQNFNLEFRISRRPGHPAAGGTRITATCSLTEHPSLTCPRLGD